VKYFTLRLVLTFKPWSECKFVACGALFSEDSVSKFSLYDVGSSILQSDEISIKGIVCPCFNIV